MDKFFKELNVKCTKCGEKEKILVGRNSSSHVGLHCKACKHWKTWVGKKYLNILKNKGWVEFREEILLDTYKPKQEEKAVEKEVTEGTLVEGSKCKVCERKEKVYEKRGFQVAELCGGCGKWEKWVGKKGVKELESRGIKIEEEGEIEFSVKDELEEVGSQLTELSDEDMGLEESYEEVEEDKQEEKEIPIFGEGGLQVEYIKLESNDGGEFYELEQMDDIVKLVDKEGNIHGVWKVEIK